MINNIVTVEGVVTEDLQGTNEQGGFYMQDLISDSNPLTSDGIFVKNTTFNVSKGDLIRVTGKVFETFGQTNIAEVSFIRTLSQSQTITAVNISFPVDSIGFLERFEGMKISVNQQLTVTENFQLGRYGEITASVNGRLFNPSNSIDPNDNPKDGNTSTGTSNISTLLVQQTLNNLSKILICDKLSIQNPNPIPFMDPVNNTLRSGSTVDTLVGVLGYDFSFYRVYPQSGHPKFNYAARPAAPSLSNSNLKVVGTNVLNYFNGNGQGGGFPTSRGAKTATEFQRQTAKIVATIKALDADVLGLMEMENDGDSTYSAIKDLVTRLNTAYGFNVYNYVRDSKGANGNPGTDAIKVALIYKPSKVTPVGASKSYNDASFTTLGRPPLAQTFALISNNEKFTVIVNHFKSKGCAASPADNLDNDQNDGQGCFNATRKKQAIALLAFVDTLIRQTGDSDIISVGDYNAYEQEDPLDILRSGNLISVLENTYSYVFNAQAGSLDHGFSTPSMHKSLKGAEKWHVNADEPLIIDYTLSFKTQDLYSSIPYRSSDHDPLITGFNLFKSCGAGMPVGSNVFTGNKTISTQTQMDAFYSTVSGGNYGNKWTKVVGNLTINGSNYADPISNLCNLLSLTEVTGSMVITGFNKSANPTSLGALDNLTTLGCNLNIHSNPSFTSIVLNGLQSTGCAIHVKDNANVITISIPALLSVQGDRIVIKNNPKLEYAGLSTSASSFSFTGRGSNMEVSDNGGTASNPLTMNFKKVVIIKGALTFNNNDNTGVSNFDNIFTGLTNLSTSWGKLIITNNDYLQTCCIAASVVVSGTGKRHTISGNTGNCADSAAVFAACGVFHKKSAVQSKGEKNIQFNLYPNPNTGIFELNVYTPQAGLLKITVTDLLGRTMLSQNYQVNALVSIPVNMSFAAEGQYILKAELNGEISVQKVQLIK